jgi:hypothetical protein
MTPPLPTEYVNRKAPEVLELCRRCVVSPLHRLDGDRRYCPGCGAQAPRRAMSTNSRRTTKDDRRHPGDLARRGPCGAG